MVAARKGRTAMRFMKSVSFGAVAAMAVSAAGCASSPVPADKLARSQAALRSAEEMGADRQPTAALHLRFAREQLDLARRLIEKGDNARANGVLARAEADAEVALNLSREASAR